MRGVSKFLLAFAAAALLSVGLAACGGGGDSTTDSTAASTTTATAAKSGPAKSGSATSEGKGSSGEGKNAGKNDPEPAPSNGAGGENKKGVASFSDPTGDNSIQSFGEEARSREIATVERVLSKYLDARAKGEWAKSCRYMDPAFVRYLEKTVGQSPQFKHLNCTITVAALSAPLSAADRKNTLTNGVAALRVGGAERAYVLYHGAGGADYAISMANKDGVWKVAGLAPTEIPSEQAG